MCAWSQAIYDALGFSMGGDSGANGLGEKLLNDDFEKILIEDLPGNQETSIRTDEDEEILVVDIENIPREDLLEASESFSESFISENGFPLTPGSSISSAIKDEEGTGGTLDMLCSYYRGKVPTRYNQIIKEAMVLRIAERNQNLSRNKVRKRKREMRRTHGNDAYAVANLCSAGYLDEGHLLWELYNMMVRDGPYSEEDYAETFDLLVSETPFVVFVKGEDTYKRVYHEVLAKSMEIDDYDIGLDFIDIRSKGESTREIADNALDYFSDHHSDIQYKCAAENDHYTIRIQPDSL